ncbi:MAG: hypothetical protein DMF61_27235 [Blastocatellia bacterium AA13]|nr:MAG: hypothetical protein DMF61_27235 [Blastocatellia bacterium AA13]
MKTEFKASLAKVIENIRNQHVRKRVQGAIQQIEDALSLQDTAGLKKLKGSICGNKSRRLTFFSGSSSRIPGIRKR